MHFYIIFGTNLLIEGPVQTAIFLPISGFCRKGISNGMKPSGELFLERKQSRRLGVHVRGTTRLDRGRGPAFLSRGPIVAALPDLFRLYISIYPKTIGEQNRSGVPPPRASVAIKNQSGPYSGTLPEGGSLTGGHLHHPDALHDEEGVVHPRG